MARTLLPVTETPGGYSHAGTALTWTAGDATNNNAFISTGEEIVLARNVSTTAAHTITILSVPDPYGRPEDITNFSLAVGTVAVLGPFPSVGWMQSDGRIYLNPSNAAIEFIILRIKR